MSKSLDELLREARGAQTKTLVQQQTKVDHGNLSRFESGTQLPSIEVLKKLAAYYGLNEHVSWASEPFQDTRSSHGSRVGGDQEHT